MTYALDTNIVSFMLKRNRGIIDAFRTANNEGHEFIIPTAVYYEIRRGLLAVNAVAQIQAFEHLCSSIDVSIMDINSWEKAAQIWAKLRLNGVLLGRDDGDIFIAAQCIINRYILVTDNIRDFNRIDGLEFVTWVKT